MYVGIALEVRRLKMRGNITWIVAQIGARMHYALPRILHAEGLLEHFFTDICADKGWPRLLHLIPPKLRPYAVARLLDRVPENVPTSRVTAFTDLGFEYARRLRAAKSPGDATAVFLWNDSEFCSRVIASPWGNARAVFTFNNAGLEILKLARNRGLITVMEQSIAPRMVEQGLLDEQHALNPGWQEAHVNSSQTRYSERQAAEWELADLIICGSDFVCEGIRKCHGPVEQCVVVPYGVDSQLPNKGGKCQNKEDRLNRPESFYDPQSSTPRAEQNGHPLRVLTVGSVGLRKGAPAVYEAAKTLKDRAQFRWVGGIEVLPQAAERMRAYVELTGSVPRSEVHTHFAWADVFLLPSVCEGSATVTYEALAWGLPVICTPNTGSVVRDGMEGFIVPVNDAHAIVECLELLLGDRDKIEGMSTSAKRRAREFTVTAYGQRLLKALIGIEAGE